MFSLEDKFQALATDDAPGQEVRQQLDLSASTGPARTNTGAVVDFSHGDVDAFLPAPGAVDHLLQAIDAGGRQAYTEYRGSADIRRDVAAKLATFTGRPLAWDSDCIITPGTQGALFLAMASMITEGDKVAIVEPDIFPIENW